MIRLFSSSWSSCAWVLSSVSAERLTRSPLGVVKPGYHVLPCLKSDIYDSPYAPLATLAEVEYITIAREQ